MIFIDLLGIIIFCLAIWFYWPVLRWYFKGIRKDFQDKKDQ